MKTNRTT